MAEGLLPPVIARLIADASEWSAGMAKATGSTESFEASVDQADLTTRKMAVSVEASAQKAAAAQERLAEASRAAATAAEELARVQTQVAEGEISAADAATEQAAAEERLTAADEAVARASLQVERASIAQAEAQLNASRAAGENAVANEAAAARATTAWGRFGGVLGQIKTLGALALGAVAVESVKLATNFQKQMEMISTNAGASQQEVDRLRGSVLALAPAVGFGPDKLAEALYHVESVGYRGADAMAILKTAAQGAQVGNANLDDSTYALTSTMKAFEMEGVRGASDAMATLVAIVGNGDMRFQDLNKAVQTGIMSTSKTFGVDLSSMGAALDFLTDRGEKADVASTRLAMGITLMAAPSTKAAGYLQDLGLASGDVTAGSQAMADALHHSGLKTTQLADDLRKPDGIYVALKDLTDGFKKAGLSADESAALIAKIFGGARTGKAVMALVQNLDGVKQKYDAINAAQGRWGEDVQHTYDTASVKFKQFGAGLETIGVKLGTALLPVLTKVLDFLTGMGRDIANAAKAFEPLWNAASKLGEALAGPIGAVLGKVGDLAAGIAKNETAVRLLGIAFIALKWDAITAGAAMLWGRITDLTLIFEGLRLKTYALGDAMRAMSATEMAAAASRAAALGASLAILVGVMTSVGNAAKNAKDLVGSVVNQTDRTNVESYQQALDGLHQKLDGLKGAAGFFTMIGHALSGKGDVVQDKNALKKAIEDTTAAMQRAQDTTTALTSEFHLTNDQVTNLAHQFGITDLSVAGAQQHFEAMYGALGDNKKVMEDLGTATSATTDDLKNFDDTIQGTININAGYQGALAQFTLDIQKLGKEAKVTSQSLDPLSTAGAATIQEFKPLADEFGAVAKSMKDMQIPMDQQIPILDGLYDKFIAAATGAGLTASAAKTLADNLGLVRPVAAAVTTPGLPQAQQGVDKLQHSLTLADGTVVDPSVAVPGALPAKSEIDNLIHDLRVADSTNPSPNVTTPGLDGALAKYLQLDQLLNTINGRVTHTYSVTDIVQNVVGPGTLNRADGGIVDFYAAGGLREDHTAQIAPAGAMRLWAEQETGGEAYIPLASAKRGRSLEVLAEVMKRFGLTAADALKMLGAQAAPVAAGLSAFAAGGTRGGDGASLAGAAAAQLGGGYGKLTGSGDGLLKKTQDLTTHLKLQTQAMKDQTATVDDGHAKLGLFTDATNVHHQAVDALIPRITAGTVAHQTDHRTVDGLTGGYHTLTDAIVRTPTAHHTNTDAPGAVNSTNQIRMLEATIQAMRSKTDRITIDTSVSGVFASLFANGGLVGLAGGGMLRGPGSGTSDSILGVDQWGMPTARVSNGEFVVNAADTARTLPLLQAINAGLFAQGGMIRGLAAGGSVSDPTSTNAGQFTSGAAALLDRVDGMLHPKAQTLIEHRAAAAVKKKIDAMSAGVGGGVARWTPLVLAAMGMLGLSPSLLPVVLSQMNTESGGNPGAINLTDSNAAAGHPSQGLMQVIPGTFAAYAGPFAGRGILDPFANIYAGLNYARSRYGAGLSALGHGHGYASGGLVTGADGVRYWGLSASQIAAAHRDLYDLGFAQDSGLAQADLGVRVDRLVGPQTLAALQYAEAHRPRGWTSMTGDLGGNISWMRPGGGSARGASRPAAPSAAQLGLMALGRGIAANNAQLSGETTWGNMLSGAIAQGGVTKRNAWAYDAWASQTAAVAKQYAARLKAFQPVLAAHRNDPGYRNLNAILSSEAAQAQAQAVKAAQMEQQARARVAGQEAVTRTIDNPTSRNMSWAGLHAPGPSHAVIPVTVKIDGKKVFETVQKQSLRNESRNLTSGLSRNR